MKKSLSSLAGLTLSLFICMNSFSQRNVNLSQFGEPGYSVNDEINSNTSNPKRTASNVAAYDDRALEHFNSLYHTVTDVRWVNSKNAISASFLQDDVLTKVNYTKKGRWSHTFVYYPGTKLAPPVRSIVLKDFSNYNILGVTEIHMYGSVVYAVNIENERNVKQLIVCNGSVSIQQEFEKQVNCNCN